jgi:hypothetical protein
MEKLSKPALVALEEEMVPWQPRACAAHRKGNNRIFSTLRTRR